MIFNKSGHLLRTPFYYKNEKLENVNKFKYLGFLLTPSGEIKSGLQDLRDRALKAFYKLKNAMGESFRTHLRISLHLFDSLIKPILLYMSDFWGGLPPLEEKYHPIEKLHYMFCKQLLGVQKQTTNVGVLLEMGRIPLQNFATKAAIKNWERIESGKINKILENNHASAKTDKLPWITHIKSILQTNNLENIHANQSKRRKHPFIHKLLHKKQCEAYHQNAFQTINDPEGKLRTYALFKTEEGCEKYLHEIKNTSIRQSFTKYRLSNHVLSIEKGRHVSPKTPKDKRFCPFCPDKVEDEIHFLLECRTYNIPRNELMNNLENPPAPPLAVQDKFKEIMSPQNAQFVAKTVDILFEIRNFLVYKPKRTI